MSWEANSFEKLKWSIYEWVGSISVSELSTNKNLASHIEALFKKLSSLSSAEAV